MKTICLLLLCGVTYGAVLNTDNCLLDDDHACRNYTSARQCATTEVCKTDFWNFVTVDNDLCTMCTDDVGKIRSFLEEKSTKAGIYNELIAICSKVPKQSWSDECKMLIEQDFEMIYSDIVSFLNPSTVCRALGLCKSMDREKLMQEMMKRLPEMLKQAVIEKRQPMAAALQPNDISSIETDTCSDCEAFLFDFKNQAKSKKVMNDWKNMLKSACNSLGDGSDILCKQGIDMFTFEFLVHQSKHKVDTKSICKSIMMCDSFNKKRVGDICQDCKTFFTDWQKMLRENQTLVDDISMAASKECSAIGEVFGPLNEIVSTVAEIYCFQKPQHMKKCQIYVSMVIKVLLQQVERECKSLVKVYLRKYLDELVQADVADICRHLEFCQPQKHKKPDLREVSTKVVSVLRSMPKIKTEVGGDHCTDCKAFITDLQGVIKNNQSIVQEVIDLAKEQCSQLGELEEVCKLEIERNSKSLMDQLEKADVGTICTTIMMCTDSALVKRPPQPSNGDLCMDCEAFFGDWQDIITNNKSVIDELNSLIEEQCSILGPEFEKVDKKLQDIKDSVCNNIPFFTKMCDDDFDKFSAEILDGIVKNCDMFIKEYLPQLWDLIAETDPSEICSTLYMCDAKKKMNIVPDNNVQSIIRQATQLVVIKDNIDIECGACQFIIQEVEKLVEGNKTEEAIEEALQEVCNIYGKDIREECKKFVMQYGQEITDFLLDELNHLEICAKLGLCNSTLPVKMNKVEIPVLCETCEFVITYLKKEILNNSTKAEIEAALEKVCSLLPMKYRAECDTLVQEYGVELIDILLDVTLSPKEVCTLIGLCSVLEEQHQIVAKVEDDAMCEACQAVVKELDSLLENNATEAEIEAALDKLCNLLGSYKEECLTIVNEYTATIIDLIIQEVDPKEICSLLKLCTKKWNDQVKKMKAKDDIWCEVCEAVMTELDQILEDNSTEAEIKSALEEVCSILGPSQKECTTFIDKYTETIINLIVEGASPKEVCSLLTLCSKMAKNKKANEENVLCEVCEAAMTQLDKMLSDPKTVESIKEALTEVCSLLPDEFGPTCNNLVNQFSEQIVQLLLNELDPKLICTELKVCPGKLLKKNNVQGSSVNCALCDAIMTELKKMLDKTSTEKEILEAVEKVCSLLPKSDRAICILYVKNYGPGVISILVKDFDPDHTCAKFASCPSGLQMKIKEDSKNLDTCDLCKLIIRTLDSVLEKNATEEEVIHALEKICDEIPQSFQKECDTYIEEYAPIIFKYIDTIGDPNFLCEKMRLCSSKVQNLLGVDPCTFGPSYWCSTLEAAKECNAVSHCRNHIWN